MIFSPLLLPASDSPTPAAPFPLSVNYIAAVVGVAGVLRVCVCVCVRVCACMSSEECVAVFSDSLRHQCGRMTEQSGYTSQRCLESVNTHTYRHTHTHTHTVTQTHTRAFCLCLWLFVIRAPGVKLLSVRLCPL